jgi:hypothetical protein
MAADRIFRDRAAMNGLPVAMHDSGGSRGRKTSNRVVAADVDGPVHHELRAGDAALP